ncbi:unnamed protein product [Adineta ricciae]|uniref:G-protein coupled receptors family 1 profile domain-containing protein n=1 Tax=Adineta ricciae TaxID=249248 RepID=A0A815KCD1_ADIRI|nr:unnamed protein product [Adineta ricciae]CAF1498760.1 unnamed protein product [Adineta ricciae]
MAIPLTVIGQEIIRYCGTFTFAVGIIGNILNTIELLSLRTFRQSPCAFYLTIMSISNIGCLGFSFSPLIMVALINFDLSDVSLFYCKFRRCFSQASIGISMTCWCLATIDQYFATCLYPRWQRFSNIKLAHYVVAITSVIWILHGIPYLIYYTHVRSSVTNKTTCTGVNSAFNFYRTYIFTNAIIGCVPIVVAGGFSLLAYRHIQLLAYRAIPLVRRDLDKQLTNMVFVQVLVFVFTLTPYTTINTTVTNINLTNDQSTQIKIQLVLNITLVLYYFSFACPFYLYLCSSERFRRQFIYVLSKIVAKPWQRPRIIVNHIVPVS